MNTAPTAMTSKSQTLKPSSSPSPTVRTMMRVKAAIVPQLLTRGCLSATASFHLGRSGRHRYNPPGGGVQLLPSPIPRPHPEDPIRAERQQPQPDQDARPPDVVQAVRGREGEERQADRAIQHQPLARLERVELEAVLAEEAVGQEDDRPPEKDGEEGGPPARGRAAPRPHHPTPRYQRAGP